MSSDVLLDALLQARIPTANIIVAYAGEPVPDAASPYGIHHVPGRCSRYRDWSY